jgi:hypothetical protein
LLTGFDYDGEAHSLPFPPGIGESFEPHIAIDPNDSNHIVVQSKLFIPGDYVGLSAEGNRVAAAFGFPLGNDPIQFATTYVKVLDIPITVR